MSLKRRGAREGAREAAPPCKIQMLSERNSNSEKWKTMISPVLQVLECYFAAKGARAALSGRFEAAEGGSR